MGEAVGELTDAAGADQAASDGVTARRHRPVIAGSAAAPDSPLRVLVPEPVKFAVLVIPAPAGIHHGCPLSGAADSLPLASPGMTSARMPLGGGRGQARVLPDGGRAGADWLGPVGWLLRRGPYDTGAPGPARRVAPPVQGIQAAGRGVQGRCQERHGQAESWVWRRRAGLGLAPLSIAGRDLRQAKRPRHCACYTQAASAGVASGHGPR
jgi:hypothetical protein